MEKQTQGGEALDQLESATEITPHKGAEFVKGESQPFTAQHFKCLACGNRGMKSEGTYRTPRGIKRYRKCTTCGNTTSTIQRYGDIERVG